MLKADIDFQTIKNGFRKTVWFLGKRAFTSFMIFVFLALFVGGAIFYYYGFLVIAREPEVVIRAIVLDEEFYQSFLDNYSQRKEKFIEADFKIYFNPFYQAQEQPSD